MQPPANAGVWDVFKMAWQLNSDERHKMKNNSKLLFFFFFKREM